MAFENFSYKNICCYKYFNTRGDSADFLAKASDNPEQKNFRLTE